jgi:hypothetical protein
VGVVLIGGVVQVHHPWATAAEHGTEVGRDTGVAGRLHVGARVRELELERVPAVPGGLALLVAAHRLHLDVREPGKPAAARRARAIGHHHPAKGEARGRAALVDAGLRHDLEIVLVRTDGEMRHAGQRRRRGGAVGDENIGVGTGEFHRRSLTTDFTDCTDASLRGSQTGFTGGREDKEKCPILLRGLRDLL